MGACRLAARDEDGLQVAVRFDDRLVKYDLGVGREGAGHRGPRPTQRRYSGLLASLRGEAGRKLPIVVKSGGYVPLVLEARTARHTGTTGLTGSCGPWHALR